MHKKLAQWLGESRRAVFFGGAGVSTESGIPDFRSESGLYAAREKYGAAPEWLLSREALLNRPELFFRFHFENLLHREAKPNTAHNALARLEDMGILTSVVTQNIDGLHQLAGSRAVYELHGSAHRNYCMDCRMPYTIDEALASRHEKDGIPRCTACGGVVRPDVVLYGEALDDDVVTAAVRAISTADVMIVGGTSLLVYPAAGLLEYYKKARLALINKSETPYDTRAGIVIRGSIGAALDTVLQELKIV